MFKRPPYLPLILSLVIASVAAVPAMATDDVPAPPAAPPSSGGVGTCTDNSRPSSHISTSAAGAARKGVVRGTASDRGCGVAGRGTVARVTVSVSRKRGARCQYMSSKGRLGSSRNCARPSWLTAHGSSRWSFRLPKRLPGGTYVVRVRALDSAGNVGLQRSLHVRIR